MTNPIQFLKEVRSELTKVVWPSRTETIKLTAVVIAFSLFMAVFLGAIDYALTYGFEQLINR